MFSKEELESIDREYFQVINGTSFHIIIKSKNTSHIWDIESQCIIPGKRSLVIHHKHKEEQPFHIQLNFHPKTVEEAQDLIKHHDTWQMNRYEGVIR